MHNFEKKKKSIYKNKNDILAFVSALQCIHKLDKILANRKRSVNKTKICLLIKTILDQCALQLTINVIPRAAKSKVREKGWHLTAVLS